jgi:tRNA nucleotidyltransferase/poly(A) polymerase
MKIYRVGGCVRDQVMGVTPKDIDYVVVGATPDDMISQGYTQVGADFPVFIKDNEEYALARTERKNGNGYHGFEVFSDPTVTLESDLSRRDFTMNAMAIDPNTQEIIDPYNGQDDIANKLIRHTSAAFCEDPVRILRACRFAARYNFNIHVDTKEVMKQMVGQGELDHVTNERVWLEFEKAFSDNNPGVFLKEMYECGALNVVFPEFNFTFFIGYNIPDVYWWNNIGNNPKHIFALISVWLMAPRTSLDDIVWLPKYIKKFAIEFHTMISLINVIRQGKTSTTGERIVEILNKFKVNHSTEVYDECKTLLLQTYKDDSLRPTVNLVDMCVEIFNNVSFKNLPTPMQQLKGREITDAINDIRANMINIMIR